MEFCQRMRCFGISIHALREEGDFLSVIYFIIFLGFLSTPSARRATHGFKINSNIIFISIHALREEGDLYIPSGALPVSDFYPRPPRGGRRICTVLSLIFV